MITETHYLIKGQYFSDIFPIIPSNTLISKNITGFGGTTSEIKADRNSIIIEPYRPVIDGKTKKYPDAFAVHSSVNFSDVMIYLKNDKIHNKKLFSTPESFYKIINACKILKIDVYNEYFLLFDECEKTITDIHYRERITNPMDEFFKFENKAFISATALVFSDPRFKNNGFKIINIIPKYDDRKEISILNTNNSIYSLIDELKKTKDNGIKKFIFLNSLKASTSVTKIMGIQAESSILCSETGSLKIKKELYGNVSHIIEEDKFQQYNFLTTRFNSGVDIELEEDIEIYIVSDANISHGTLVNPNTDVFQIIGRFRESKVKKKVTTTVIASTDSQIKFMKEIYVKLFLTIMQNCYSVMKLAIDTLSEKSSKIILTELSKLLSFNTYLNEDGTKNYFMIDNLYYNNLVKSYYYNDIKLNYIYRESILSGSKVKRYRILKTVHKVHNIASGDVQLFGENKSYREILSNIVLKMMDLEQTTTYYLVSGIDSLKSYYKQVYPEIIEAYEIVGGEVLLTNCYSKSDVAKLLSKDAHIVAGKNFSFLAEFKETFYDGRFANKPDLISNFRYLLNKHKIENISKANDLVDLERFVEISSRTRQAGRRGYRIGKCKY